MDKTVVKFSSKIIHQESKSGMHNIISYGYIILISQMINLRCFLLENILILKNVVLSCSFLIN